MRTIDGDDGHRSIAFDKHGVGFGHFLRSLSCFSLSNLARLNPLVIAGLDPAIHHSSKKMDTRVKPAYDDRIC
jgi:hypothetical protein